MPWAQSAMNNKLSDPLSNNAEDLNLDNQSYVHTMEKYVIKNIYHQHVTMKISRVVAGTWTILGMNKAIGSVKKFSILQGL